MFFSRTFNVPPPALRFKNRNDAGIRLASKVKSVLSEQNLLGKSTFVLGLPRGGIPLAAKVAESLHCGLGAIIVRKLGAPYQEELAIGALTASGTIFVSMLNENTVRSLEVPQQYIDNVVAKEQKVATDRQKRWGTDPKEWKDCDVVLIVDDGIATGMTAKVAIEDAKKATKHNLHVKIFMAIPVISDSTLEKFEKIVDVIAVEVVETGSFYAIGQFYDDFTQVHDSECATILAKHAQSHQVKK